MQSTVLPHPQGDKEVSTYLGRDLAPMVQAYAAATIDLPFLSHTLKYFRYAEDAKDDENFGRALDPDYNQDRTELLEDLAFFYQRGYQIDTSAEFIDMVSKHPITLDASKVILRIKLDFRPRLDAKASHENKTKNITMESPTHTYTLRNWTSDEDHKLESVSKVGIYLQDIVLLMNYLRTSINKLYDEHWNIEFIDVGSAQYVIDSVLGSIITIDMTCHRYFY